ncbi:MAG: hypothetical protein ACOZCO_03250 [Bacteroidota bacterium]
MERKLSSILIIFLVIASCKKEADPPNLGYTYFPLEVGRWAQYNVTEIKVDTIVNYYDTAIYQLKEVIESQFIDNQGRPSFRIERFWRTADSLPWTMKDVWFATRTNTMAEKVEEDERFVKMVFPVNADKEWNGNIYNTLPEWEYAYENLHKNTTVNSLSFDSTTTVLQRDNYNFIEYEYAYEIYAAGVGLIKKHYVDLDISNYDTTSTKVKKATIIYQSITAYGN